MLFFLISGSSLRVENTSYRIRDTSKNESADTRFFSPKVYRNGGDATPYFKDLKTNPACKRGKDSHVTFTSTTRGTENVTHNQ